MKSIGAPKSPGCKDHTTVTSREERRLCLLARWKQEKLEEATARENRELSDIAAARLVLEGNNITRRKCAQSRVERNKIASLKIVAAEEHSKKGNMIYRGWLPWVKQVENARLQAIKAWRSHQYCVASNTWTQWVSYVRLRRVARRQHQGYQVRT